MNKKILLFTFSILFLVFIFPSFKISGPDCLAGCKVIQGIPFSFLVGHAGGVVSFDGTTYKETFLLTKFLLDCLVWFSVAILVTKIIQLAKKSRLLRLSLAIFFIGLLITGGLLFYEINKPVPSPMLNLN